MHIHGKDLSGKYGILAIQFTTGSENPFLKSLNPYRWDFTKSFSAEDDMAGLICLKGYKDPFPTEYNMQSVLNGPESGTRSFFRYTGSLTKPPCDEGVEWFILKNPAQMKSWQLSYLKSYGLSRAKISPNNIRSIQNPHDRKILSQVVGACPPLPPVKIEPPNDDYKYIRASHTTTISGMAGEDAVVKEVFDNISDSDPNDPNKITLSDDLHLTQLFPGKDNEMPKEITPDV